MLEQKAKAWEPINSDTRGFKGTLVTLSDSECGIHQHCLQLTSASPFSLTWWQRLATALRISEGEIFFYRGLGSSRSIVENKGKKLRTQAIDFRQETYLLHPTIFFFNLGGWQQKIHKELLQSSMGWESPLCVFIGNPLHLLIRCGIRAGWGTFKLASCSIQYTKLHPTLLFPPLSPLKFPGTQNPECICNVLKNTFRQYKLSSTHSFL